MHEKGDEPEQRILFFRVFFLEGIVNDSFLMSVALSFILDPELLDQPFFLS